MDLLTGLGIDEYLTRTTGGTTENVLSEALGSTVALADGSGAIATEYSYEPFGTATASGTSSSNELGYTDPEGDGTGVYYYRARYYHPGRQRFLSEGPARLGSGPNLFAYVRNNPLRFVDPLGLAETAALMQRDRLLDRTAYVSQPVALHAMGRSCRDPLRGGWPDLDAERVRRYSHSR